MANKTIALAICTLLLSACGKSSTETIAAIDLAAEARRIAASSIIVDTHVDAPMLLVRRPADISVAAADRQFDYPRAKTGDLNVPFMSIYTDAELEETGGSFEAAEELIDAVEQTVRNAPTKFAIALSPADVREQYDAQRQAAGRAFLAENPGMSYADLRENFLPGYEAEHGVFPFASIDDVLDHFDHVVSLAGIDHVGIGSDFDGVGDSLPTGLKDVASYPNLIEGLLNRGYSEQDMRKVLGENLLRVWSEAEAYAVGSG